MQCYPTLWSVSSRCTQSGTLISICQQKAAGSAHLEFGFQKAVFSCHSRQVLGQDGIFSLNSISNINIDLTSVASWHITRFYFDSHSVRALSLTRGLVMK